VDVPARLTSEQEDLVRRLAATEKVITEPHQHSFFKKLKDLFTE
jgi:DnaJ-class molecular chaperone